MNTLRYLLSTSSRAPLSHSCAFRISTSTVSALSLRRCTHSQSTDIVFSDPTRPELFYHLVEPPTPLSPILHAYALSFLPSSPPNPESSTVMGWLPARTYLTDTPEPATEKNSGGGRRAPMWGGFRENPAFKPVLHESIYAALRDGADDVWINAAKQLQEGWMHIHDQRNPPPLGRIGDPDDIIASVLVEDSIIKPDTYQPMPSYRVCTVDGVTRLTPGLMERLVQALQRVAKGENANVNP